MKYGLVLEGGAMRGLFTAGVLDVFLENDIKFDGCVGTSAGAVFGCNYKSKQIGRTLRYNVKYSKDKRYASLYNLFKTGDFYGRHFCYEDIPNYLDPFDNDTYIENPMEFYVCCTDLKKGEPIYHKSETGDTKDIEWMRASASMPLVSNIVKIDDKDLLDGGMTDSIPIKFMESIGYKKNVVILTQPKTYRKKRNKLLPMMRLALRDYPKAYKAMERRHIDYNNTVRYIEKQSKLGDVFVIRPSIPLPVGRTEKDPYKLKLAYYEGRFEGKRALEALKKFMA